MNDSSLESKLDNIYLAINYYFILIIVPIGIVTNMICILIFSRSNMNKTNMGFFNILLALSNILTLLFYMFLQNSSSLFGYDLSLSSDLCCKLYFYLRRNIRELAPTIECLLSFDRFINVCYPKRFNIFANKIFRLKLILFVLFVLAVLNIENLFFYLNVKYTNSSGGKIREIRVCTASESILIASDMISAVLRTFIPFVIMTVLSTCIITKVIAIKRNLNKSKKHKSMKKEYQFTITIISMNISFLLMSLPEAIGYILKNFYFLQSSNNDESYYIVNFVFKISYIVSTSHYCVLFFFNFFHNILFRNEIFSLFRFKPNNRYKSKTNHLDNSISYKNFVI